MRRRTRRTGGGEGVTCSGEEGANVGQRVAEAGAGAQGSQLDCGARANNGGVDEGQDGVDHPDAQRRSREAQQLCDADVALLLLCDTPHNALLIAATWRPVPLGEASNAPHLSTLQLWHEDERKGYIRGA